MADEEGFITQKQYDTQFQDYYRPINITDGTASTSATFSALPDLATQSGIQVSVDKPNMDTKINKISNVNENVSDHFNIFSLKNNFKTGTKLNENSYQNMMDAIDGGGEKKDKNDWLGKFGTLPDVAGIFAMALGGKKGVGATLTGPTGNKIFSAGLISETANKNHYANFLNSQQSYEDMSKQGKTHFNFDTGFAAKIGNHHFSRSANGMRFEGNLTALHSDSHTAHMMLKSMDAMSKGLDPRGSGAFSGYRLDGQNENNRGMSDAMLSNGMGGISNDGYYTYVSGADLGHTKSKLYGGNLTKQLASGLREKGYDIDGDTLVKLMAEARKGDKSFTELLNAYKTKSTSQGYHGAIIQGQGVKGFTSNIDKVGDKTVSAGTSGTDTSSIAGINKASGSGSLAPVYTGPSTVSFRTSYDTNVYQSKITPDSLADKAVKPATVTQEDIRKQDARREEAEKNRAKAREEQRIQDVLKDRDKGIMRGFNTGGQVSSPIGQLANMLRANRLGYNQGGAVQSGYYGYQEGGQINMQEMGFVNGKTPDQVTDAQSVADTEAMSADEGDFVINAPAVEAVGVEAIIGLVSDALTLATEEGVEIVDIPQDTSPEVMVDILVSEGEFIVPRELIPFIDGGLETLEKINALGTDEVSQRVEEGGFNEEAMMEQMGALEAPPEEPLPEEIPPQEIPEIPDVPMRYGDIVRRIIPSAGFV